VLQRRREQSRLGRIRRAQTVQKVQLQTAFSWGAPDKKPSRAGFLAGVPGGLKGGLKWGLQGGLKGGLFGPLNPHKPPHMRQPKCGKMPSASTSRRRSRTQFAALHAHGFTAEVWPLIRRIPTAIQWHTRRVKNRLSDDPGPCRRCAAALSSAADAPTYLSLGLHARSGLRMRRSPRRAVPCGHRNGASLSATDASKPAAWRRGSTHPDHRMRGWIRLLTAGGHRNANGWGPLRRGTCTRLRTHRFIGVKPDLAHALRSGCRQLCPFAPVGRARIARQAWAAHRWAIGIRVLRSTNVNGMFVGPC